MKKINNNPNYKLQKMFAVAILSILRASSMLAILPTQAQESMHGGNPSSPNWAYKTVPSGVTVDKQIQSQAFLSTTPNPIGLNQELLINIKGCMLKT